MLSQARDTITALSTAPGSAGIAVVRLSGPRAFLIAAKLTRPLSLQSKKTRNQNSNSDDRKSSPGLLSEEGLREKLPHARATRCTLYKPCGGILDQSLVLAFHAPNSYTGESLIEFHVHGSPYITKTLLDLLLDDAALADPGEFTRRAIENGRMDLAQAEGVGALVSADSSWAHQLAVRAMDGDTTRRVEALRQDAIQILALLEAELDFSEEEIEESSTADLQKRCRAILSTMQKWRSTWQQGRLSRGADVMILGEPNAGKSTLMNTLLGEDRVIVTPQAGTTRDMVAQSCTMGRLKVNLWDTAGLRGSEDSIEQEGVRRALDKAQSADLLILLLPPGAQHPHSLRDLNAPLLIVKSKCDLPTMDQDKAMLYDLELSANTGEGINELCLRVEHTLLGEVNMQAELVLSEWRHAKLLDHAMAALERALSLLQHAHERSLVASELREATEALGAIHGGFDMEEVLDSVFSQFCIGK